MKTLLVLIGVSLSFPCFAAEISRKPSQVGGPITILNKSVLIGELNCNDRQVTGQVLINSLDQHTLVSDLMVQGKAIELGQVQAFRLDDSTLFVKAPGLLIQAKMGTRTKGQATIGVREGVASIGGKKLEVECLVPEISDFPM